MGVVKYCTPAGGSGYITNPALPWLSTFNITHQSPVYDQDMGWMRESQPGSFTYYNRFGPPYSADGGVLPPYRGGAAMDDGPEPYDTSCQQGGGGMGDLILRRADVVAPLPSMSGTARAGCDVPVNPCDSGLMNWAQENPLLAAGLAVAGAFVLFGGKR
jgi:hypothetical protein